jgi:hypothetical protein
MQKRDNTNWSFPKRGGSFFSFPPPFDLIGSGHEETPLAMGPRGFLSFYGQRTVDNYSVSVIRYLGLCALAHRYLPLDC